MPHSLTTEVHPMLQDTQHCAAPHPTAFHPTAMILGSDTTPPLDYTDVYLDDFLLLAQPPNYLPAMNRVLHAL